jgi:hypothetical protein
MIVMFHIGCFAWLRSLRGSLEAIILRYDARGFDRERAPILIRGLARLGVDCIVNR